MTSNEFNKTLDPKLHSKTFEPHMLDGANIQIFKYTYNYLVIYHPKYTVNELINTGSK